MPTRKLKMPDGGTMDLAIPAGFGDPDVFGTTEAGRMTMYLIGGALGAVAGFLIVYAATKIADAVERR
jgi:hypothetical protein